MVLADALALTWFGSQNNPEPVDITHFSGILSSSLEFEADGIIILYHIKKKGIRCRAIEVLKMRSTRIPEKTVSMQITDKGLDISPDSICIF
jgi:KaiC/GvpD/RAD55 family RecA-like ATPase|tara:strand:+ start:297 stop:572 length:276 start_codon:yes stop_codon:yes gene_type:complete